VIFFLADLGAVLMVWYFFIRFRSCSDGVIFFFIRFRSCSDGVIFFLSDLGAVLS
jgi:hypothetical protein